jgi:hypothetical protein
MLILLFIVIFLKKLPTLSFKSFKTPQKNYFVGVKSFTTNHQLLKLWKIKYWHEHMITHYLNTKNLYS